MPLALILLAGACVLTAPNVNSGPNRRNVIHMRRQPARIQYLGIVVAGGTGVIIVVGGKTSAWTISALLILLATIVWTVVRVQTANKSRRELDNIGTFLELCTGNLRAGVSMIESMNYAISHMEKTNATIDLLVTATRRAHMSGQGGPAMLNDSSDPTIKRIGILWEISQQHGIPLVALMEQMCHRIDARHRTSTRAALQGPRATAIVLTLLPVLGVAMGMAMGADPIGILFGGGIGGILLVAGVGLTATGFIVSQKILDGAAQ